MAQVTVVSENIIGLTTSAALSLFIIGVLAIAGKNKGFKPWLGTITVLGAVVVAGMAFYCHALNYNFGFPINSCPLGEYKIAKVFEVTYGAGDVRLELAFVQHGREKPGQIRFWELPTGAVTKQIGKENKMIVTDVGPIRQAVLTTTGPIERIEIPKVSSEAQE